MALPHDVEFESQPELTMGHHYYDNGTSLLRQWDIITMTIGHHYYSVTFVSYAVKYCLN